MLAPFAPGHVLKTTAADGIKDHAIFDTLYLNKLTRSCAWYPRGYPRGTSVVGNGRSRQEKSAIRRSQGYARMPCVWPRPAFGMSRARTSAHLL
jgi:hypothetical protein